MVERKLRPAPFTLVYPPVRAKLGQVRPGHPPRSRHQALRARHQRADARSHEPVPLRGARRLPADGHARGARQQQERHVRGRAQRAPGEPLPRRARQRHGRRASTKGIPLERARRQGARRAGCSCRPRRSTASCRRALAERQGRQPDHRRRHAPAGSASEARGDPGVARTSTCASRRARSGLAAEDYFNDKVLEDTDLLYTGMRELPADFWDKHGKDMESWQQGGHTYYRVHGPLVPSFIVNEFVYHGGREAVLRAGEGSQRQDRGAADAQGLHATSATTSGASPRATASRTSRSTC